MVVCVNFVYVCVFALTCDLLFRCGNEQNKGQHSLPARRVNARVCVGLFVSVFVFGAYLLTCALLFRCGNERTEGQHSVMLSKAFALAWYRALTWYCSPARPFAALDVPLLVTGQQGGPPPRADIFPGLKMRARGPQAKKLPS